MDLYTRIRYPICMVLTVVLLNACGNNANEVTAETTAPTATTSLSTTVPGPSTTSSSTTTTSTTLAMDPSEVAEYISLITLVPAHESIPESAPRIECDLADPEQVRIILGIDRAYSPPVDVRDRSGECSWGFGDFLGDGISVSTLISEPPGSDPGSGNIPRIYDALAREIFARDFADLTHGEAATVRSLTLAKGESSGGGDCVLTVVGNNAEFLQSLGCLSVTYVRTYGDGSDTTVFVMTGLGPTGPIDVDFDRISELVDYLDQLARPS